MTGDRLRWSIEAVNRTAKQARDALHVNQI